VSFTEAASNLSGTLTVTDGTRTAAIELLGQYAASEFTSAGDGGGGMLIGVSSAGTDVASATVAVSHHA
jgi:hypothetical protein